MFKQLITSTLLATSIGVQNTITVNFAETTNKFISLQNTYQENEYYNEILERSVRYSTVDYKQAWVGTNLNVKARGVQKIDRNIVDNEYYLWQYTVLKLDSSLDVISWWFGLTDQPQYETLINTKSHNVAYYTNPSNDLINFLNGEKYYSYQAMQTLFSEVGNATIINPMSHDGNRYGFQATSYIGNYLVIESTYEYDPNQIVDEGQFLMAMIPYTDLKSQVQWNVPSAPANEIVDIPGMMFTILGMPFAWISTAFNFTIFPGTAYAVNLSNILMAVIIGLIVLYIVKKIIK